MPDGGQYLAEDPKTKMPAANLVNVQLHRFTAAGYCKSHLLTPCYVSAIQDDDHFIVEES